MVVDANHPAVPTGLPEGPPSGRLTYAGSNKANAPWHGHPAWGPQGLARESQGRPGRAVAGQAHGRDARDTHGQDAHATHGRDAHATPAYDQAGSNVRGPRPPQGPQGPADPNANNAAHFRYDAWNRLATIHLDNGDTAGTLDANDTLLATYRYDGLNRRVKKVTHADANTTTDYVYHNESWQVVEIRCGVNQTPTAAPYKQFVWDIRYIDSPVCRWWDKDSDGTMEPTAGEMQYFTNDGNFNVTALVDANSGSVVERYLYDPYGKVTVLNGASGAEKDPNVAEWSPDADNKSDWDNEILFCGYWYDPETGLYHVRERYYDPITGTWKTRDRILYPDGMNMYQYVGGSPVNRLDPYGRDSRTDAEKKLDAEIERNARAYADKAYDTENEKVWPHNQIDPLSYVGPMAPYAQPLWYDYYADIAKVQEYRAEAERWWTDSRHSCGPNVSEDLRRVVQAIKDRFNNERDPQIKCDLCYTAFNKDSTEAATSWDIQDLHGMTLGPITAKVLGVRVESWHPQELRLAPEGSWKRSVQVDDRCYDAAAVNYVMYGVIGRLCEGYEGIKEWEDVWARVRDWKLNAYGHLPTTETTDWAYDGWMGWPNSNIPRSERPYPVKDIAGNKWSDPGFRWSHGGRKK